MENDELRAKLEQVKTEEQFRKLCEEYDFTEISETTDNEELSNEQLNNTTGGFIKPIDWHQIERWLRKKRKSSASDNGGGFSSGGGGGGGGRGF